VTNEIRYSIPTATATPEQLDALEARVLRDRPLGKSSVVIHTHYPRDEYTYVETSQLAVTPLIRRLAEQDRCQAETLARVTAGVRCA
jgi:predicted metallo-beta-lactamase superfamily hydrolase